MTLSLDAISKDYESRQVMRKKVLHELPLEFIRSELSKGRQLSQFLLEQLDLEKGEAITFLPFEYEPQIGIDFEESIEYMTGKNVSQEYETIIIRVAEKYLQSSENNIIIFETLMAVNDPILKEINLSYFSYNGEIYLYIINNGDKNLIKTGILAAQGYPCVILLTKVSLDQGKILKSSISLEAREIQRLIYNSEQLIIGAYDGEGYLIWRKKRFFSKSRG
jgi:hypothetical protein